MAPPHSYHPQVPTSTGKVHPPFNPTTRLDIYLTHGIEGNSTFDASTLNIHFYFCMHGLWSLEFPKEPRISPRGSDLQAFQFTHDTASQTFEVPKFKTPKGTTLTHGDMLNAEVRTGEFRALHSPSGPSKKVPRVHVARQR
jgi:hypothetical protein